MTGLQTIRVRPLEWAIAMHESEGERPPVTPEGFPLAKRKAWRYEPGFRRAGTKGITA